MTSTPAQRWLAVALAGTFIALNAVSSAASAQIQVNRPAAQTKKKIPAPYANNSRPPKKTQLKEPAAPRSTPSTIQRAELIEEAAPEEKSIWNKIASAPRTAWESSANAVKKSTTYIPFLGNKKAEASTAYEPTTVITPPAQPQPTAKPSAPHYSKKSSSKPSPPPDVINNNDNFDIIEDEAHAKPVWSRFIPSLSSKKNDPLATDPAPTPADIASARSRSKKQFGPIIKDRPKPAPQVAETQANSPDGKPIWNRITTLWPFQADETSADTTIPEAKIEVVSIDDTPFYSLGSTKGALPEGYLTTGTLVQVESKSWGWSNIRLSDGRTGMVPRKMLRSASSSDLIATKKPGKLPSNTRAIAARGLGSGFRSKPRNPANYIGPVTLPPVELPDLPSVSPDAAARNDANSADSSLLPPLDPSSPSGAPFSASPLEGSEIPPPTEPPATAPN